MAPSKTVTAPPRASTSEQLDVWTAASAPTSQPREQLEHNLIAIARELARKAGGHGITMADVRIYAQQRGLLTGEEGGRALSWLSLVPKRAGLVATGQVRPSTLPRAHGNYQRIHVLPEYSSGGGR